MLFSSAFVFIWGPLVPLRSYQLSLVSVLNVSASSSSPSYSSVANKPDNRSSLELCV